MPSIGRFFQSDAVAGGDQATAETDPALRERSRMSGDGRWWWDGERWQATGTTDGLWQWDGERWRPTIELRGVRARDLATTLAMLAEDRYARAAAILVERAREWRPQGELRDLVHRAASLRGRLLRVERAFAGDAAGPPGLLRRVRARPEDRQRIAEEQVLLDAQYRSLMVLVGRRAPRPTVKEADDMLEVARLLDRRAARITESLAAADEAERARARAIEAARRELEAAESARRDAAEAAAREVAQAEEEREAERRERRGRLRAALEPQSGEPVAQVGPLGLRADSIETPAGHLPADGARAWAASAVALWRQHRDLLEDLVLLETPEGDAFLRCLTERRRDLFLLLAARSRTALWHCPAGEEKPLRRFVTAVNGPGAPAAAAVEDRLRAAEALWTELARDGRVRPSRAEAVEAARAEAEARMDETVAGARRRLDEARREPPELVAAREAASVELRAVATPPRPLTTAQR
ncbi:MAG TPA: hypothetical protein VLW53_05565 [Candidatus Eisenbacteria bacterium]|nr:hypothetical protein [Candidatus Eisenbacteria bacterium]